MKLPAKPIGDCHEALSDRAASEIRGAILSGRFRPGQRLVEGRLAASFNISRVPVREALRVLASEGLVEVLPRRGAIVATFSDEAAREMLEVRAYLEGLNARLAAKRHEPELIHAVEAVLKKGNAAAEAGELEHLVKFNCEFHDLLARAGSNTVLADMMRTLRDRTSILFPPLSQEQARQTWKGHAGILEAVIAGDADLAEILAKRHVTSASLLFLPALMERSKPLN
jgi:DNA-binding GntR family transcriptional regulator